MGKLPSSHSTLKLNVSPSSINKVLLTVGFTCDAIISVVKKTIVKEVSTRSFGSSRFCTARETLYGLSYFNFPDRKYDFSALKVNKPLSLLILRPMGEFLRNQKYLDASLLISSL